MGYCSVDPCRDLPSDIFKKQKSKAFSHTLNEADLAGFLRMFRGYKGYTTVKYALMMAPYVFLRPGELASLKWSFVDFDKNLITIPSENMKMKREHLVPLSKQVKRLLLELKDMVIPPFLMEVNSRTFSLY